MIWGQRLKGTVNIRLSSRTHVRDLTLQSEGVWRSLVGLAASLGKTIMKEEETE